MRFVEFPKLPALVGLVIAISYGGCKEPKSSIISIPQHSLLLYSWSKIWEGKHELGDADILSDLP